MTVEVKKEGKFSYIEQGGNAYNRTTRLDGWA